MVTKGALAERTRERAQDRGEVEAVVQASEFGASVIVDDPWGRELSARDDWIFMELYGFFNGRMNWNYYLRRLFATVSYRCIGKQPL